MSPYDSGTASHDVRRSSPVVPATVDQSSEPGPRFVDIDEAALDALIARVEEARDHALALSAADLGLLLNALLTLANLHERLEHNELTIRKMRKLLGIVRASERLRDVTGVGAADDGAGLGAYNGDSNGNEEAGGDGADGQPERGIGGRTKPARRKRATPEPVAPSVHHHPMADHARGDECPACHRGTLHKYQPSEFTRIRGHSPYTAERHVSEQLRCSGCGQIHRAPLPGDVLADGAAGQRYGYSARAAMAIYKHFGGQPYHREQTLQGLFGVALSASTVFEQCEQVADALNPVYRALQRHAATAGLFYLDDTTHRILGAKPVEKTRNGKTRLRTGVYASAVLGLVTEQAHEARACERRVVLFQTSIGQAGEWMDEILTKRPAELPAPIVMSDAASANTISVVPVKQARCNSHGRRDFVDVAASYPDEALYALETYAVIWQNDRHCSEAGLDPAARLAYHRKHSAGPMNELKAWCEAQLAGGAVEANGTLGGAMRYFVRHFDGLTLFVREPGAPIDNNEIERLIKLVVRSRKNSSFYRSEMGAQVADVLMSVLATCHENAVNGFEYLVAVQRNREAARASPERWLPWNYPRADAVANEVPAAAAA